MRWNRLCTTAGLSTVALSTIRIAACNTLPPRTQSVLPKPGSRPALNQISSPRRHRRSPRASSPAPREPPRSRAQRIRPAAPGPAPQYALGDELFLDLRVGFLGSSERMAQGRRIPGALGRLGANAFRGCFHYAARLLAWPMVVCFAKRTAQASSVRITSAAKTRPSSHSICT